MRTCSSRRRLGGAAQHRISRIRDDDGYVTNELDMGRWVASDLTAQLAKTCRLIRREVMQRRGSGVVTRGSIGETRWSGTRFSSAPGGRLDEGSGHHSPAMEHADMCRGEVAGRGTAAFVAAFIPL